MIYGFARRARRLRHNFVTEFNEVKPWLQIFDSRKNLFAPHNSSEQVVYLPQKIF
jgi:hypothetical protein